ncbi:glutathione S-transferase [Mycena olivaceomarginata]|nr:glutathione S-transferase [Mycena olivaceomarginata]
MYAAVKLSLRWYSPIRHSLANYSMGIVALVLVEKQIAFEHIAIDMNAQGPKHRNFLRCTDDDGFILYESRAICRYLSEKYPDHGTPSSPKVSRSVLWSSRQLLSNSQTFTPPPAKSSGKFGTKGENSGLPIDHAAVDAGLADLSAKLDVYEVILGKQKFLAGDSFTLADLFHYAYGPLLAEGGVDLMTSKGPNVARWWNELLSRPAWIKLKAEGIKGTAS